MWPKYSEEEIDAVVRVLKSGKVNFWTGTLVKEFERRFSDAFDCGYCTAVSNGTVALELIIRALALEPKSEIIVPSRSYFATAAAVSWCGHIPVFADVDETGNIDPESMASLITGNTRAVIVAHIGGIPADMSRILKICRGRELFLIEDCAQAHGAKFGENYVGSIGDAAAWSFCQDKIISTGGEGGMIAARSEDLHRRIYSLKDHGKNFEKCRPFGGSTFNYVHDTVGTNARMTELQAAIGLIQLESLSETLAKRKFNAETVLAKLGVPGVVAIQARSGDLNSYYRLYLRCENQIPGWKGTVLDSASRRNLPVLYGSCCEIYRELAYREHVKVCTRARKFGEETLAIQVHEPLSPECIEEIASLLRM